MVMRDLTSTEKGEILTVTKKNVYIWGRGRNNLENVMGKTI